MSQQRATIAALARPCPGCHPPNLLTEEARVTRSMWFLHCLDNEHMFIFEADALAVAAAYLLVSPNAPRLWRVDVALRPDRYGRTVLVQAGDLVEVELTP